MKTYWLGIRDSKGHTDIRGPFNELEGALRETKLFKPYSGYEFIVFPLYSEFRGYARLEAKRIWATSKLLEDHIVGGWMGYIGRPE